MDKLISFLATAALISTVQAQYTYTLLNHPDTVFSPYNGSIIEGASGNNVVGNFYDGVQYRAFLFDGTTWTTLSAPDAVGFTAAYGVSGNTVVGTYLDANSVVRGFSYNSGVYTSIDYPAADPGSGTYVSGISGSNIVASVTDAGIGKVGLYDGSTWTLLSYPAVNVTATIPVGISGSNIVGSYQQDGLFSANFFYDGSDWSVVNYPGAQNTYVTGVSGQYTLGRYIISDPISGSSSVVPYLYDGTNWTDINQPEGSMDGYVTIKSMSGDTLYGTIQLFSDNSMNGFVATIPEPSTYALLLLGGAVSVWFVKSRRG